MYKISHDNSKNRIYVTVIGRLELEEIDKYIKDFKTSVDKCKSGFTVCVDNTNASVNIPEVSARLVEIKTYSVNKGLKNSAIIVNSTVFKMQMRRLFDDLGNVFATLEDANNFLDNAPQA